MIDIELKGKDTKFENIIPSLDGKTYNFKFRWDASRTNSWYLKIGEVQTEFKLVCGIDILRQWHHLDLPVGELRLVPVEKPVDKPDFDALGDTVRLVYV